MAPYHCCGEFHYQDDGDTDNTSTTQVSKKDGKGIDVINMHVSMREAIQTASRRAFTKALL